MNADKNFDMLFVPNTFHSESGEHAYTWFAAVGITL